LLKSDEKTLAFVDFGMMADVSEEERYGLIGLAVGLQQKNLPLITENLLKVSIGDMITSSDDIHLMITIAWFSERYKAN